ncbi:hypothetical protein [Aliisedimentitalea sp. MJ-SS2]|uniref:hypothetical protein n=1 Tax=Aliisedimentitalea sp. MJ-SS2 TaxID=3049795 RepID=UPI002931B4F8|nr:hypothetical protein [Alisedimentitalea sp. MJ-SS2]
MAMFTSVSILRSAGAMDKALLLKRMGKDAARMARAVNLADETKRTAAVHRAHARIVSKVQPVGQLMTSVAAPNARKEKDVALAAYRSEVSSLVRTHCHHLRYLAKKAGPLGLGFTTLALVFSLMGFAPEAQGNHSNLLQALPVSLVTTMLACFNLFGLRWVEGRLVHAADTALENGETAFECYLNWARPETPGTPTALVRRVSLAATKERV